ncbi:MAG: hypothetical protein PHP86_16930 [Nevskiales bacterium]|nr:hypothetical protein [Nevskiales bacterium]
MTTKPMLALAVAASTFLAACGGGSSEPTADPVVVERSAGPLDVVQDGVSGSVLQPLADAVAGTALEGVVRCADSAVTYDVLDLADIVLTALQAGVQSSSGEALAPDNAALTRSLAQLANDLTGLLQALAGEGDGCSYINANADPELVSANLLAGTPLAPLGAALGPVLEQIIYLTGGNGDRSTDLQLTTVANLVTQLTTALQLGLSQVPAGAYDAPVVGGLLATLNQALSDVSALLGAVTNYDTAATRLELQNTLNNTLVNLLTQVLPLSYVEDQAGRPGALTDRIEAGVAELSTLVGTVGATALDPVLSNVLAGALDPLLDPIENELLPALLGPISALLSEVLGTYGEGLGGVPTDGVAAPFADTALAPIISLVASQIRGLLTGDLIGPPENGCLFANTALLRIVCGLGG